MVNESERGALAPRRSPIRESPTLSAQCAGRHSRRLSSDVAALQRHRFAAVDGTQGSPNAEMARACVSVITGSLPYAGRRVRIESIGINIVRNETDAAVDEAAVNSA